MLWCAWELICSLVSCRCGVHSPLAAWPRWNCRDGWQEWVFNPLYFLWLLGSLVTGWDHKGVACPLLLEQNICWSLCMAGLYTEQDTGQCWSIYIQAWCVMVAPPTLCRSIMNKVTNQDQLNNSMKSGDRKKNKPKVVKVDWGSKQIKREEDKKWKTHGELEHPKKRESKSEDVRVVIMIKRNKKW